MAGEREPEVIGDDEPFRAFVAARMPALLLFAHLVTGDPHTADDLVQAALMRTALAWHRVIRKDDPEGYVRRAILRQYLNLHRTAWRRREAPSADLPDRAEPADRSAISRRDEREAMWQALSLLPPRQRAVLVLRYYEDLSEAEIAGVLGCAPGTVKSQAAKALTRLRSVLNDGPELHDAKEARDARP